MSSLLNDARDHQVHLGLLLEYGLIDFTDGHWQYMDDKPGAVKLIANYDPENALYKAAFERWHCELKTSQQAGTCCLWWGRVNQRLFLGLGERTGYTLETAVTLDPTYGMPMIPGSTLKGLSLAVARYRHRGLVEQAASATDAASVIQQRVEDLGFLIAALFGRAGKDEGCLRFLPAWWDPNSGTTPLVQEVITPHHQYYYAGKQPYPSGQDSPVPAPQLAVTGRFLFTVEGVNPWCSYGVSFLKAGLSDPKFGVGAASHVGYGLFVSEDC